MLTHGHLQSLAGGIGHWLSSLPRCHWLGGWSLVIGMSRSGCQNTVVGSRHIGVGQYWSRSHWQQHWSLVITKSRTSTRRHIRIGAITLHYITKTVVLVVITWLVGHWLLLSLAPLIHYITPLVIRYAFNIGWYTLRLCILHYAATLLLAWPLRIKVVTYSHYALLVY